MRLVVPAGVRLDRPFLVRWAVGDPGPGARLADARPRSARAPPASLVEELVAVRPGDRLRGGRDRPAVASSAGRSRSSSARAPSLAVASIQDLPSSQVAFQHRHATIGEGGDAPLGARPARRSRLVRSRVDNRLEGDRSSVEQVEIVFGDGRAAVRPDLATPATSAATRPATCSPRARSWTGPGRYMKGLIVDREVGGRDRQLPRRVRDEPVEAGPRGGHPEPRDRPARLPPGRPLVVGRADRRDPAVLPREPRDRRRTRRASSSSSASSSRSSRGSRWPRPQERLRGAARGEVGGGIGAGDASARPDPGASTGRPGR